MSVLSRLLPSVSSGAGLPTARPLRPLVFGVSVGGSTAKPHERHGSLTAPRDLTVPSLHGPARAGDTTRSSAVPEETPTSPRIRQSSVDASSVAARPAGASTPTVAEAPGEPRVAHAVVVDAEPHIGQVEAVPRAEQDWSAEHRPAGTPSMARDAVAGRPTAPPAALAATAQQHRTPDVYIHIGSIEIRPVEATAAPRRLPVAPLPQPVSLAEYLRAGG